jgi:hypothetical protein
MKRPGLKFMTTVTVALFAACGDPSQEGPGEVQATLKNPSALDDVPRCGANGGGYSCASGSQCYILHLRSGREEICSSGDVADVCDLLQCPTDWKCMVQLSSPLQISCGLIVKG